MHRWFGGGWRRPDFSLTFSMVVILSTLALLVGMVEGHHTNRFGDWLLIPSPTLSRYMIMGNSFNCLTIIDYLGGRALDLESRHLDTWLHTFLAGRLWGKSLSLSNLRFFSYTIVGITFTNYLTELWWEYISYWNENTILERAIQKWEIIFYYLFTTVFHCLLNLFSFLLSNNHIFHVFLNTGNWSMGMMSGTGVISVST